MSHAAQTEWSALISCIFFEFFFLTYFFIQTYFCQIYSFEEKSCKKLKNLHLASMVPAWIDSIQYFQSLFPKSTSFRPLIAIQTVSFLMLLSGKSLSPGRYFRVIYVTNHKNYRVNFKIDFCWNYTLCKYICKRLEVIFWWRILVYLYDCIWVTLINSKVNRSCAIIGTIIINRNGNSSVIYFF